MGAAEELENCTVDVSVPLKGGKVHGSLARAGKVRGQTPKVEAQEKKEEDWARKEEDPVQPEVRQRGGHLRTQEGTQLKLVDPPPPPLCHRPLTLSSWFKCQYFLLKPDKIHPCFVVKKKTFFFFKKKKKKKKKKK